MFITAYESIIIKPYIFTAFFTIKNIFISIVLIFILLALYEFSQSTVSYQSIELPHIQSVNVVLSTSPTKVSTGTDTITPSDVTTTMKLTFSEEFATLSRYLDVNGNVTCKSGGTGIWQTVYNFCYRTQPNNGEEQVYIDPGFLAFLKNKTKAESELDPDNPFTISKGILAIEAKPSSEQVLKAVGPWAKYTSGLITTQFSFSQTYGYFEIRAKLPKGKGLWPAFWLLPIDETWPPEVDVLEAFGGKGVTGEGGLSLIHFASHAVIKSKSCGDWHDLGVNLTQGFHTYGVDVEQDGITYYFDRKPYASCPPNPDTHKPFYMLINLAVGGWPGSPDSTTVWPAYMYVDYVKAYQRAQ